MRVLNIDLDFFQDDIAYWCSDNERLDSTYATAWTEEQIIKFLENNLKLDKSKKIKGRIFKHHDETFYFWRELIEKGMLDREFDLVHIDAHADLGYGGQSIQYITTEYLNLRIEERLYPENLNYDIENYKINFSNYLIYAIACNWIKNIDFITHPHWNYDDLPCLHFKNCDIRSEIIQLKKFERGKILMRELEIPGRTYSDLIPIGFEKEIPFKLIKAKDAQYDGEFDFISLSLSPGYTVKGCDKLIDIIKEFIEEI